MNAVYGITIEARDARTGNPIGNGATAVAVDGTYRETLELLPDSLTFVGASERPGRYRISITKPGYEEVTKQATVRSDECHVEQVRFKVQLRPSS